MIRELLSILVRDNILIQLTAKGTERYNRSGIDQDVLYALESKEKTFSYYLKYQQIIYFMRILNFNLNKIYFW